MKRDEICRRLREAADYIESLPSSNGHAVRKGLPIEQHLDYICERYGIRRDTLFNRCQIQELCHLRYYVWKKLRDDGFAFIAIGRLFDRHHTTIMAGVAMANKLKMAQEPKASQ